MNMQVRVVPSLQGEELCSKAGDYLSVAIAALVVVTKGLSFQMDQPQLVSSPITGTT